MCTDVIISKTETGHVDTLFHNLFQCFTSEAGVKNSEPAAREKVRCEKMITCWSTIFLPQSDSEKKTSVLSSAPAPETDVRNRRNVVPYTVEHI